MIKFIALQLVLFSLGLGQPAKSRPTPLSADSIAIKILAARVDSLSTALRIQQLADTFAEKSMQAYKDAGTNQTTQYLAFVGSTILVLLAGFGGVSWFIYKRSKDEQKSIAEAVTKTLTPLYTHEIGELDKDLKALDGEFRSHLRNYNKFATERETKDTAQDSKIQSVASGLSIQTKNLEELSKGLVEIHQTIIDRDIEILDQLKENARNDHEMIRTLLYITLIFKYAHPIINTEIGKKRYAAAVNALDGIINNNGDFKMSHFPIVKNIYPTMTQKDQAHFDVVEDHIRKRGKNND